MFIQSYTEVEGNESQRVAHDVDLVMKEALGDRPSANGRQSTAPLLCARMLQEYEAARQALVAEGVGDDAVEIVRETMSVGMSVKSPSGLTLCHAVQGSMTRVTLDAEDLHYHQQWLAAPMEIIERGRVTQATLAFLEHATEWLERMAAAYKADSKGVRMRNMALNNMDAYLARYFKGTGITYYFDKQHADERMARLLVRLNAHKTLDLPIPHDDFIGRLDVVRPHMVKFAIMARDGHFTVRNEARSRWQCGKERPVEPVKRSWWRRLWDSGSQDEPSAPDTPLMRQVRQYFDGKPWYYALVENVEDDEPAVRDVHVRLCNGMSMIIDLRDATDVDTRLENDMAFIDQLVELRRLFPYRLTGGRKVEWVTAPVDE